MSHKHKHKHRSKKTTKVHHTNVLGGWGGGLFDEYGYDDYYENDCVVETSRVDTTKQKKSKTTEIVKPVIPVFKVAPVEEISHDKTL